MLARACLTVFVCAVLAGCADSSGGVEPLPSSSTQVDTFSESASESASDTGSPTSAGATSSSRSSTTSASSPTPSGTSKDADQLVLLAADIGTGWSSGPPTSDPDNAAPNATDYAEASVQRYSGTPRVVDTYVDVFATSAEALAYYNSVKADLQGHTHVPVQAGDQAFRWTDAPGYLEEGWIVKQNVVWYLYIAGEGGSMSPTTDTLMKKAAAKF